MTCPAPRPLPRIDPGLLAWRRWARVPARAIREREPSEDRWLRRWASVSPAVKAAAARGELRVDPVWGSGIAARAISARVFGGSDAA
jgi:hypothetical protein